MNSLFDRIVEVGNRNGLFRVQTHDGPFHLDDALAVAIVWYFCRRAGVKMKLIRSRDIDLDNADIFIDVGGIYCLQLWILDHHQRDGAGRRASRILPSGKQTEGFKYSAVGLLWKNFGPEFVQLVTNHQTKIRLNEREIRAIAEHIDKILIQGICAFDTGERYSPPAGDVILQPLGAVVAQLNPSWIEIGEFDSVQEKQLEMFLGALPFLVNILSGFVLQSVDFHHSKEEVLRAIRLASNGVLVLHTPTKAWRPLVKTHHEIQLVVQPLMDGKGGWGVYAIESDGENGGRYRCSLPDLTEAMIRMHTGITGVTYVHENGFFASTETRRSAIELAQYAMRVSRPARTTVTVHGA